MPASDRVGPCRFFCPLAHAVETPDQVIIKTRRSVDLKRIITTGGTAAFTTAAVYFSPLDPHTLYVNVQHSVVPDGDGTWAISRKRGRRD